MKKVNCILILSMLVTGICSAQDSVLTLTLKDAVKIGLENNLTLNQQENLMVSTQVSKTASLLRMGPTVSASLTAARTDGNSFDQQEGRSVNGVRDYVGGSIEANMPLFAGLSNYKAHRQAASQYEAQIALVHRTNQDVIRDVVNQYLACLLDQQIVMINERNLETQQSQYRQIEALVEAGSRAEVDLMNQSYQVKNAELLSLRSKNTLRNDVIALLRLLQLDPTLQIKLNEPTWDIDDYSILSSEQLYEVAKNNRSDLKQTQLTEKAFQYGYQSAKGSYFPALYAFASYGSNYNYIYRNDSQQDPPRNRSFRDQFFNDWTSLQYGLTLQIPIYSGFANRANVVRNRIQYENAKLETENREIIVKSDVLLAYQNLKDAQANFEAAEAQLQAAEVSYSLEKERYDLGISDIVALTQATQARARAEGDYASAKYTLMFQQLLINYAIGTLKLEDVPEPGQ